MPDLNVNVFRINRTSLKDPLMQFLCFFLSQKKRLQDTCELDDCLLEEQEKLKNMTEEVEATFVELSGY